ncbi:MAG: helix-turn-helix transcriptional regulator [Clostridiales bacterium]|nr:helix-turn-helix transcriptional regulator [Clostridiales bacterium]
MIGFRIKELRMERGLSQQALAKHIGVSQKAIDYWERNVNEPKASYIVILADFFSVSADFLLGARKYKASAPPLIKRSFWQAPLRTPDRAALRTPNFPYRTRHASTRRRRPTDFLLCVLLSRTCR